MEVECNKHRDIENRVKSTEEKLSDLEKSFIESKVNNAKIEQILENLAKLPDVMTSMEKTLISMQYEIKEANQNTDILRIDLKDLEKQVSKIDSEGKFNIRTYLKRNFPLIAGLLTFGSGIATMWISTH